LYLWPVCCGVRCASLMPASCNPLTHQMTDNNNLRHHTTTQIAAVLSQLEGKIMAGQEKMEGKMVAGQEKMETQLRELKTGLETQLRVFETGLEGRVERMETQLRVFATGLEKMEERMEGKMVAGQEKMEKRGAVQATEMKELQQSIQSLNKIAIASIVAAVVLQGDLIKPLLAIFFKRLL